ncbi:hypothetical protein [Pseudomonas bharatica]|uniref:hypothetical protein n=1 Tax=Pseudomonas bharatica TaxID=2692112 RepID=UPI0028A0199A|nr:hypothetical protein [Pseudomonas bharatica]
METPEGPNIGLINSLAAYARTNQYGFLESPYRVVKEGVCTDDIVFLSAIEEADHVIAQASAAMNEKKQLIDELVAVRHLNEFTVKAPEDVTLMDVSPKQVVSVAASLIPFLEHDDANRALMGSNMQRQAVPTLRADKPLVGTGMERNVARDSGVCVVARRGGVIDSVDASRIVVRVADDEVEPVKRCRHLQPDQVHPFEPEHLHQPASAVNKGDVVQRGDIMADGPSTDMVNWLWVRTCASRSWHGTASTSKTPSACPSVWSRKTASPRSTSRN